VSDVFSPEKRSEVMSRIKGKGNKETELQMVSILKKYRIKGWRRNQKIFGKPDFVFWKERVALFVDGCFWHNCPLHSTKPKNNSIFWENKLKKNQERDIQVNHELKKRKWHVIRIWEHELKDQDAVAFRVRSELESSLSSS